MTNTLKTAYVGGIAGRNEVYSFILSCEVRDKAVTAEGGNQIYAGGITGQNYALIAFCRTGRNVVTAQNGTGSNRAGGLVGNNDGFLYSCYSRATATAPDDAGAIVGYKSPVPGREQHCYATGAADKGTSNLDAVPDNIVYDTNPTAGEIFRVISGYTGEVKSLDNGIGRFWYPFTTSYTPAATPAYGIIPLRCGRATAPGTKATASTPHLTSKNMKEENNPRAPRNQTGKRNKSNNVCIIKTKNVRI